MWGRPSIFVVCHSQELTNPPNLTPNPLFHMVKAMEVHFPPELEAVEKGIAAAGRGDFIDQEEMDAPVERMFNP